MSDVLILAPHPDDELLGCYAQITKSPTVIVMAHLTDERCDELQSLASAKRFEWASLELTDGDFDGSLKSDVIRRLDVVLRGCEPKVVMIPRPSFHQDHRFVHEVSWSLLRPQFGIQPPAIVEYEYPTAYWPADTNDWGNLFVPIDAEQMVKDFEAFYPSQFGRSPTSEATHMLRAAGWRGMAIDKPYAEAYHVRRAMPEQIGVLA